VLDDRGTGLGFQQVQEIFPFSRHFQTGFANPASYTVCIRGFLPEAKRPLRESDQSPSYRVEVKNVLKLYFHFTICFYDLVLNSVQEQRGLENESILATYPCV
jgi:hypothetical protein